MFMETIQPTTTQTITFALGEDGKVGCSFQKPAALQDVLQILFTGSLAILKSYTPRPAVLTSSSTQNNDYNEARGEIYDLFNVGASAVLEAYAPELALHPDLTTEAIFEAEKKLLQEKHGIPAKVVKAYADKARAVAREKLDAQNNEESINRISYDK
jgi:hypothetical protein